MRFNPPPNWPPAPPGWAPDPGWRPDPSWPPPPPGWPLWVPSRPTGAVWAVLAVIVAAVTVIGGSVWYFTGVRPASRKHDISTLTTDLLLDRSQFSAFGAGEWDSQLRSPGEIDPEPEAHEHLTISPPECGEFDAATESARGDATVASARLTGTGPKATRVTSTTLTLPAPARDVRKHIARCGSFTITSDFHGTTMTQRTTLRALHPDGLPPWATAYVMETTSDSLIPSVPPLRGAVIAIEGRCRGVLVDADQFTIGRSPADDVSAVAPSLVSLFNTQVAKLEAAP